MRNKLLFSGNQAFAYGAWEFGAKFASAYPGTPSTEILEEIGTRYPEIEAQWSPNEKVAFEVAMGASIGGLRSLVAMKHVGLNVAADPLFTSSYTGVNGGFVIISADDPGMHSSQNEQDNRNYAKFAKIPCLEPSDSQEAKDFVGLAFSISEEFDTPVLIRSTTRLSHSKSLVRPGKREEVEDKPYIKDIKKWVVIPAHARLLHIQVEERLRRLGDFSEGAEVNRIELGKDKSLGIIASGISYQYAKEIFPQASFLKLGIIHPLPKKLITKFSQMVDKLWVVEENDPFIEEGIRAMGIETVGKERGPTCGELNPELLKRAFEKEKSSPTKQEDLPPRPPALCPGCSHRGFYYGVKKLGLTATGDIGCYTLAVLPPLSALDTCVCMGASVGNALGMEKALRGRHKSPIIATIGDSTFIHSGITSLIDLVYNKGEITLCILDNESTAMTGHQDHPGTGKTLRGEPTKRLDYIKLAQAIGIERVRVVDPYDLSAVIEALKEETEVPEPSVIIFRRICALKAKREGKIHKVNPDKCIDCGQCLELGCPAIYHKDGKAVIDPFLCMPACNMCQQVCKVGAIEEE